MTAAAPETRSKLRYGLGLSANISPDALAGFWQAFKRDVLPTLKQEATSGSVQAVLPFQHKPTGFADDVEARTWSVCIIIVLAEAVDAREFYARTFAEGAGLIDALGIDAVDAITLQQNLDMFYTKDRGLETEPRLLQWLEYVVSDPGARSDYYQTQYRFSGPAMRAMREKNWAGRFVGFEVEERLFASGKLPEWDVIHISGFTLPQIAKYLLFSRKGWDRQAQISFGAGVSSAEVMGKWASQRKLIMPRAKQIAACTIQSADLLN